MRKKLFLLFLMIQLVTSAQTDNFFHLDSLPRVEQWAATSPGLFAETNWKYQKGDNLKWADSAFDDASWKFVAPELNFDSLPANTFENIGWFRLHIIVDTSFVNKTLGMLITHSGASEIYLDGKLIHSFGTIDTKNPTNEERVDQQEVPVDIRFEKSRTHVLAVRYANARAVQDFKSRHTLGGFNLKFAQLNESISYKYVNSNVFTAIFVFYFTFFIALSFLHFIFFLFYRANKSNLYYSIFAGAFGTYFLTILINRNFMLPDFVWDVGVFASLLSDFYVPALLAMLYSIFYKKLPKIFWIWMVLFIVDFITTAFFKEWRWLGFILYIIFIVESLRIIIAAIYKKLDGSWILGSGIITTIGFFGLFFVLSVIGVHINFNSGGWGGFFMGILVIYVTLSIPLSMTVYLARDFSKTSKNLSKKLIEVEELSAKSMEQEKEKQKILETQKEVLEVQVEERTHEIVEQKKVIEEKNKDITDSINYAKRIQEAILPPKELKYELFPEAFILLKPKDIVSGDFYWFTEKNGKKIIAACDCTGHGVPGALMSMIGNNFLNQIVNEQGTTSPGEILNRLHEEVRKSLKQNMHAENRDGMDVSIITLSGESEMEYAGAQRPLWLVRNETLEEIKADKFSIGGLQMEDNRAFTNHKIAIQKNDCIYICSDGYADQFGGEEGKKFMSKNFKELLLMVHKEPMMKQESIIDETIEKWRGNREQIDDILVIGIKI